MNYNSPSEHYRGVDLSQIYSKLPVHLTTTQPETQVNVHNPPGAHENVSAEIAAGIGGILIGGVAVYVGVRHYANKVFGLDKDRKPEA